MVFTAFGATPALVGARPGSHVLVHAIVLQAGMDSFIFFSCVFLSRTDWAMLSLLRRTRGVMKMHRFNCWSSV